MRISVTAISHVDLDRPGLRRQIEQHITRCLKEFPEDCEGQIDLDGDEHCFTYVVWNGVVELTILPRELVETISNENDPLFKSGRPN
jgi:hypothetical protein